MKSCTSPTPSAGEEARDEDVRVGEVELLRRPALGRRGDPVVAAALPVEDRAEDARRVEVRAAVPVDRAVGAHERRRVEVADDPVLGDREVARERGAGRGAVRLDVIRCATRRRSSACGPRP